MESIRLEELGLPTPLLMYLRAAGYRNGAQLYSSMAGSPEVFRPILKRHGVDYSKLYTKLGQVLGALPVKLEEPVPEVGTSALEPDREEAEEK